MVPGKDQLLVTGQGGPSGTGKKPSGETILPPPVFIQDSTPPPPKPGAISRSQSSAPLEDKDANKATTPQPPSVPEVIASPKSAVQPTPVAAAAESKSSESKPSKPDVTAKVEESKPSVAVEAVERTSTFISITEISSNPKAFNGVTWNAVFPVPASSLSVSVWAMVGQGVDDNLTMNPFSRSALSFSELLDLTLPPIDANLNARIPSTIHRSIPPSAPVSSQPVQQNPSAPVNGAGFDALRQLLPAVNVSFGVNGR